MLEVILKRFDQPDETRTFSKGKFELVRIGGMAIGRTTYDPGWRWSIDVGGPAGLMHWTVEHVGLVISGKAVAAMEDGRVVEMKADDLFYIAPGHDSWSSATSRMSRFILWVPPITPSTTTVK